MYTDGNSGIPDQGWQSNQYPQPQYGPPGQVPQYGYAPQQTQPQKGRGLAIAALVLGILGCCFGLIPILGLVSFPLAIVGLVLGVVALVGAVKGVRAGKGMAIAGTVLCILALVLAIVGVAIVNNAVNEVGSSLDDATGASTSQILADNLDVELGKFVVTNDGYLSDGELVVTLRNKGQDTASFSVKVEAVDASGVRIEDDTTYVTDLAPGQAARQEMFKLVSSDKYSALENATFKVIEVTMT